MTALDRRCILSLRKAGSEDDLFTDEIVGVLKPLITFFILLNKYFFIILPDEQINLVNGKF